ncbi:MAG TPA: hypothetical protein DCM87_15695 [Planctomycetes bacterium]|nr:hypothetical protein [Planctomycetota bacterium]
MNSAPPRMQSPVGVERSGPAAASSYTAAISSTVMISEPSGSLSRYTASRVASHTMISSAAARPPINMIPPVARARRMILLLGRYEW